MKCHRQQHAQQDSSTETWKCEKPGWLLFCLFCFVLLCFVLFLLFALLCFVLFLVCYALLCFALFLFLFLFVFFVHRWNTLNQRRREKIFSTWTDPSYQNDYFTYRIYNTINIHKTINYVKHNQITTCNHYLVWKIKIQIAYSDLRISISFSKRNIIIFDISRAYTLWAIFSSSAV